MVLHDGLLYGLPGRRHIGFLYMIFAFVATETCGKKPRAISKFHPQSLPRSHIEIEQFSGMRLEIICCKWSFKSSVLP